MSRIFTIVHSDFGRVAVRCKSCGVGLWNGEADGYWMLMYASTSRAYHRASRMDYRRLGRYAYLSDLLDQRSCEGPDALRATCLARSVAGRLFHPRLFAG